mmetsp:Transcript_1958/g.7241  ORF Transcript_1958/g.7241 Transcript_1958/m.7241 type:complete len:231 (+) Transcript_1958:2659-3351(+)
MCDLRSDQERAAERTFCPILPLSPVECGCCSCALGAVCTNCCGLLHRWAGPCREPSIRWHPGVIFPIAGCYSKRTQRSGGPCGGAQVSNKHDQCHRSQRPNGPKQIQRSAIHKPCWSSQSSAVRTHGNDLHCKAEGKHVRWFFVRNFQVLRMQHTEKYMFERAKHGSWWLVDVSRSIQRTPQFSTRKISRGAPSSLAPVASMSSKTSRPSTTWPKTTCFPSSWGHAPKVM